MRRKSGLNRASIAIIATLVAVVGGSEGYGWLFILPHSLLPVTMERILRSDNVACQEAQPHGLDHWVSEYPRGVASVINCFLDLNRDRPAVLTAYARPARCAWVQ